MPDLTTVNPQIKDAVAITNATVLGAAVKEALSVVRQQVTQSTGLAVQDSVDQLQQLLVLNSAVTGKALSIILTDQEKIPQAMLAMETIQKAVTTGIGWFQQIGDTASKVAGEFPTP